MNITLNNGVKMPMVGLGTYLSKDGNETYEAVLNALEAGYRLIDTAAFYKNESSVGQAIKDSGINRSEIFVTTKLWNTDHGYKQTKKAFDQSLRLLGLDYIDLYLIHWPTNYELVRESYKAMEDLYHEGKIKALGVSNFNIHHIDNLLEFATVKPMVNQVECHPGLQQHKLQEYCEQKGIKIMSHSPLMRGKAFEINALHELANKYKKSIVNIIVRWGLQRNIIMIPKSVTKERIQENFQVFNFQLSTEDMHIIRKLNNAKRLGSDPDNIDY
jgi:methylglyoxal/glyoxal reductase